MLKIEQPRGNSHFCVHMERYSIKVRLVILVALNSAKLHCVINLVYIFFNSTNIDVKNEIERQMVK